MNTLLPAPEHDPTADLRYWIVPLPKPRYWNPVPADKIIADGEDKITQLHIARAPLEGGGGHAISYSFTHPLLRGMLYEDVTLHTTPAGLITARLVRTLDDHDGRRVRREEIDFLDDTFPLPEGTYPEVMLPFLLSLPSFDSKTRAVFAWITDRFLARVHFYSTGRRVIQLRSGAAEAVEVLMYPNLNDWIPLGNVISRLIRPFIPKYRMWYAPEPPHTLLRFEGPYGPPGAPEIVLELAR